VQKHLAEFLAQGDTPGVFERVNQISSWTGAAVARDCKVEVESPIGTVSTAEIAAYHAIERFATDLAVGFRYRDQLTVTVTAQAWAACRSLGVTARAMDRVE
jgi:hypothetical protein